jgi:hypothetical protein
MAQLTTLFADCAALGAEPGSDASTGAAVAEAITRACAALPDAQYRRLERTAGATPDDVAAALRDEPFADRVAGAYLPLEWLESFCTTLELPLAEVDGGLSIGDGEATYFCPVVQLADDPDSPEETRAYVRADAIQAWAAPES